LYVTVSVEVISLPEAAAGKSRNVHKAFKPKTEAETEVLTHDTEVISLDISHGKSV